MRPTIGACETSAPVAADEHPRIASYQADPGRVGRVLLLYSGGLDTSVMLRWIQERYGAEIVALTVDLGQPGEEWDVVVGKARDLGAVDAIVADAREEFAREYVLPAIKANGLYGGGYPLFTALARPLIAKLAVACAHQTGCDTIAHGCTGKGNDQVRIEGTIATLDPELRVLAPVREWRMGREEEIAYAREHGIPVKGGTEAAPYSIDDNLWGRSSEGGSIEDLGQPTPADVFRLVTRPEQAPDQPELIRVGFEAGCPVSLDGERLGLVELIERIAEIGARHGVGIVDQIEDRIVGLKVRDIYEVPAAAVLLPAHGELEKLVSTIHQNNFKRALEDKWAYLCYSGLWHEPLRADLDAYMDSANEHVTGELTVKLYKGSATVVARSSPYALYDQALAGFGESGGEFSQHASPGFIELFTLQSRMAHRVRSRRSRPDQQPEENQ
jgi:argininosuccinate synthase